MGAIDQTLFDNNITNTLAVAEDLKNSLGKFPAPAESNYHQEVANANASARDVVSKVALLAGHKTPGTIDQTSFDAEMKILLVAKDSLQAAEDALQDSYTDFTSAANVLILDIEALAGLMTDPPTVTRATKAKEKKTAAEARHPEKEDLGKMAHAKAGAGKHKGFFSRR